MYEILNKKKVLSTIHGKKAAKEKKFQDIVKFINSFTPEKGQVQLLHKKLLRAFPSFYVPLDVAVALTNATVDGKKFNYIESQKPKPSANSEDDLTSGNTTSPSSTSYCTGQEDSDEISLSSASYHKSDSDDSSV